MPRTLFICRSTSEACLGAVSSANCGFVVQAQHFESVLNLRATTATIFGVIDNKYSSVEESFVIQLITDTLEAEEYDVWLWSDDEDLTDAAIEAAEDHAHKIHKLSGSVPNSIPDPFSLFAMRRMRNEPGHATYSQSYCQVDPIEYGEVKVGLQIYMRYRENEPDTNHQFKWSEVFYTDSNRREIGLHGILQYVLDEDAISRLSEVESTVRYISWGRGYKKGRQVKTQTVIFDIPADVDAMLADARLPRDLETGGHL